MLTSRGNTHSLAGPRQQIHSDQEIHSDHCLWKKREGKGLCWECCEAQKSHKSSLTSKGEGESKQYPSQFWVCLARRGGGRQNFLHSQSDGGHSPANTAALFNSQQLYLHSARQIDFTSPQLNVGNYGCLRQGTALPGLRRKKHIPVPLML